MIELKVQIKNLDRLRESAVRAPQIALKYLGKATQAAIFEIEKEAVDRNFQFKTPRAKRTGNLERSFKFGRYIHPSKLMASIGPTATAGASHFYYPLKVYESNKYMDRIAQSAEKEISKHFEKATELIVNEIGV